MQPLFSPAVNYNTEFPQLGSGHRPQISIEQSPRSLPQQMRGPWPVQSAPSPVGYGPPDGMMTSFNPNHVGSHPGSSMYMHPSQYPLPMRPGISLVHLHEHVQFFAQVGTLTCIIVWFFTLLVIVWIKMLHVCNFDPAHKNNLKLAAKTFDWVI